MAWIDYQRAFDSVPHSWIIKSWQLIGINNKIIIGRQVCEYASTCRREANRNRRYRNITWNIARRLIVTTAILH
jgi:hypothetical protein